MIKEGVEDMKRHRADWSTNSRQVHAVRAVPPVSPVHAAMPGIPAVPAVPASPPPSHASSLNPLKRRDVRVGNLVFVRDGEEVRRRIMCDTASYYTPYIPFIHLYCRICTYEHPLYMYIHHIYTL